MRKAWLLLGLLLAPSAIFAQGGSISSGGILVLSPLGRPIGGATVTVCAFGATGIPCSPTITVYTDPTLVTPALNPATSDGNGSVFVYAAPGSYTYTVTGTGITGKAFTATVSGSGGGNVINGGPASFTTLTVSGTATACNLQGLIYVTSIAGCSNTLAAAVAAAAGGSYIILPPGSFTTTSTITVSQPNIHILGSGIGTTFLAPNFATGNIFTLNANNFELGNMTVLPSVARTSGWLLEALGKKFGSVHDLLVEDTYGGFHMAGAGGVGAGGWNFFRITTQTSGGTHSGSLFSFGGGDGSPVADMWVQAVFSNGTGAIYDAPQVLLDSGCDTNQFISYHAGYSTPNTSTQPVIQTQFTVTGGSNFAPRWIRFEQLSIEAGGSGGPDNFKIIAGNNIVINDSYLENAGLNGLEIVGGANTTGITVSNTVIAANQKGGIYVTTLGAPMGLDIHDNEFSCNSQFTNNTFDNIQIAGGTTFVQIHDNQFGDGLVFGCGATLTRYGVNLLAGATDQYTIMGNQYSTLGTAAFLNAATGLNFLWNDKQGGLNLGNNATAPRLRMFSSVTKSDWQFSCQDNVDNGCEITPSTAAGGSTFSTPGLSVSNNGAGGASNVKFDTGGITPRVAGSGNFGTNALPAQNLCLGTAATNNICTSVAATAAARTLTYPDPLGNVTAPYVIASGTTTLTSNAALAAVTSQVANTTAAANVLTTDSIEWSFATAPTAGDNLCHVLTYVTAGNVNFVRTNPTAAAQNVSALVINWRVIR